MEFYFILTAVVILIMSFPYIRMLCKRLRIFISIDRKSYKIEPVLSIFSPCRISRGFTLTNKETGVVAEVYMIFAHNKRETVELTDTQFRIKKRLRIMGGRIGSSGTFSWHTPFVGLPSYITGEKKNKSYILFNPVPLEIKYNYKDVYPDDIIFGSQIVTGTKLLSKID